MSNAQINTKVCIIGAGTTGLLLANILSKYHISYIVVEQGLPLKTNTGFDPVLIDSKATTILEKFSLSDR